jgi:hypothetical protein
VVAEGLHPGKIANETRAASRAKAYREGKFDSALTVPDCLVRVITERLDLIPGVTVLFPPMDADSQLVELLCNNVADIALVPSNDSDMLVYGDKGVVYRVCFRGESLLGVTTVAWDSPEEDHPSKFRQYKDSSGDEIPTLNSWPFEKRAVALLATGCDFFKAKGVVVKAIPLVHSMWDPAASVKDNCDAIIRRDKRFDGLGNAFLDFVCQPVLRRKGTVDSGFSWHV